MALPERVVEVPFVDTGVGEGTPATANEHLQKAEATRLCAILDEFGPGI